MKIKTEIDNLQQLDTLAKAFAKCLQPKMIVLLQGDLGSGKTTFVKAVAKALGSTDEVTSPTFALLNVYNAKFPIEHFDMYRLSSAEEARGVGFDEHFDRSHMQGVAFVEWPENVEGLIDHADFVINITKSSDNGRIFVISSES